MSWDSYRDTLVNSGAVKSAAICGLDGGVWAASPGFDVAPDELKTLINGLSSPKIFQENGVTVGKVKYMYLQSDESQIQAKKGAAGISIAKSGKCLIIGVYTEGQQPGNCRTQVERIRDYLTSVNY